MKDCIRTYDGIEFDSLEEQLKYIAGANTNEVIPDELTQDEVVKMIEETGKKVNFVGEREDSDGKKIDVHEYNYDGKVLKSVSDIIEETYKYRGGAPEARGVKANKSGTLFHNTAEEVITKLNEGKKFSDIEKEYASNAILKSWVKEVNQMYQIWSDGGRNKVLTEFRISNIEKGVAGTVDVAVVYPDGSLEIFDFKGTGSEYRKPDNAGISKRRGNNLQLNLYKRMLEVGDTKTGAKKLRVRGAAIVPIEFDIVVDGDDAFLQGFQSQDPIPFDDKDIFGDHRINEGISRGFFPAPGFKKGSVKLKINGRPDWNGFINTHLGIELDNLDSKDAASRIAMGSSQDPKTGEYYFVFGKNRKRTYYTNPESHKDTLAGVQARTEEILASHAQSISDNYNSPADDFIRYLNEGEAETFSTETVHSDDKTHVELLTRMYVRNIDRAVKANTVKGMEAAGDDVVLVYKGYNQTTGSYSSIDILTLNKDITLKTPTRKEKGTTILGRYMSNAKAKGIPGKAGLGGTAIWYNTRENAHMLRMGLIAMQLQKDNPNTPVDRLSVGGIGTQSSGSPIGRQLSEVMDQFKIMEAAQVDGASILDFDYGVDSSIKDLFKDERVRNRESYKYGAFEAYLRYAGLTMTQVSGSMEIKGSSYKTQEGRLYNWLEGGSVKKLLSNIYTDMGITGTVDIIMKNEEFREDMLKALTARQHDIEGYNSASHDKEGYLHNPEYLYVSNAILDLKGMTAQFSDFKSIGFIQAQLVNPGMSGIEIVDEFIGRVQRKVGEMNRALNDQFFSESKKMHKKLIKDTKTSGSIAMNRASDVYEPLLERIEVFTDDGTDRKVSRHTGRFWPQDSSEYKLLSDVQKEYIGWYKKKVRESMVTGLEGKRLEEFNEYWDEDMIPAIAPSTDTRAGDLFGNKAAEGSFKDRGSNYVKRVLDPYTSKNEYIELASDNYQELVDKLEVQKKFQGEVIPMFGDVGRMERLGFTADGKAITTKIRRNDNDQKVIPVTRTIETNLESVLGHTMANKYRYDYLSELLPEYKSVKAVIAYSESALFRNNKTLMGYLKNYTEKNLFQKNQITEEESPYAKAAAAARMGANIMLLDYNVLSQIKNGIAGFYHTISTGITVPKFGKNLVKAYGYIMTPSGSEKANKLMWNMGLANADTDQLINGFATQMGKRGFANSQYKNLINYGGDHFHRSVFMISQMMYDGTMKAYDVDADGNLTYDENKDPRFEGEDGKKLKEFLVEEMRKEGSLNSDGTMARAYTSMDMQRMKRFANESFDAQNNEDQENFRNTIWGIVFGQYRNWWFKKVQRYAMRPTQMTSNKKLVKTIDAVTKEVSYSYEGEYMEGIGYTLRDMIQSTVAAVKERDISLLMGLGDPLNDAQKTNLRRMVADMAMILALIGLGGLMFDDEDEDTVWYYMYSASAQEINLIGHIQATPILGTGEAIPAMGVLKNALSNPWKTLTHPGFTKVFEPLFEDE